MKAIVLERGRGAEALKLKDVPKPLPRKGEVLVKVEAASVTRGDVALRKMPKAVLAVLGAAMGFKPMKVPGIEFAGSVEAIGSGVDGFLPGDLVAGTTTGLAYGANAEYVTVPVHSKKGVLLRRPAGVDAGRAAAVLVGGMTAQFLFDKASLTSGDRVLIYGALGSVGSYAVQLAKIAGAHVTAVAREQDGELLRSLFADEVLDYTAHDFALPAAGFDLIFDAVGKLKGSQIKAALKAGGRSVSVKAPTKEVEANARALLDHLAAGKLRVIVEREISLDGVSEAHRYVETGRKKGNIIIRV